MGKALYRKHRSTSFSEVVGQEHITKTLTNAISAGKISHAYLFTGPRGVGKTSIARILAHEVNNLDYAETGAQLDIIEIDAASNRRIDEIRDLRDKVHIPPTSSKYKVYIIDEVHMLTKEAFNALLKTLEEPPAHCIFILATTEANKVPDTIISRTQRFDFHRISNLEIVEHLKSIAKKEKIQISDEALELIARHGGGSFRDSIGMLDQLSSQTSRIEEDDVRDVLGMPSADDTKEILAAVNSSDVGALGRAVRRLEDSQSSVVGLVRVLADEVRRQIVDQDNGPAQLKLLKDLLEVEASVQPWHKLLVALVEATEDRGLQLMAQKKGNEVLQSKYVDNNEPSRSFISSAEGVNDFVNTESVEDKVENAAISIGSVDLPPAVESTPPSDTSNSSAQDLNTESLEWWPEVVTKVKDQAASIYTALRLGRPVLNGNNLEIHFQFALHQKKLDSAKSKDILASIITDVTGKVVLITTAVDTSIKTTAPPSPQPIVADEASLSSISNIFGGAEVLES